MPTWGTVLSPQEISDVVSYIRTWSEEPTAGQSSDAAVDAGELYITTCAACHGAAGEGGVGPPLVGNDFVGSQELPELVQFLAQGRQGTAMPGFGDRLSTTELTALAELLLGW